MTENEKLIETEVQASSASEQFRQYVKALGRGQRASRDLSFAEAQDAMTLIMQGEIAPEQLGAFLMLMRLKEETADELAGFVSACRKFCTQPRQPLQFDLDIGCYAGKRRHHPWLVLAMMLLAENEHKIVVHGSQEPDSNRFYLSRAFSELGLPIINDVNTINESLDSHGLCYVPLAVINPVMQHLIDLRRLFALRSPINTIARMLNPFAAEYSVHGVFHRHFDQRHAQACAILNDSRISCFRGEGGEVEFNPERDWTVYQANSGQLSNVSFAAMVSHTVIKPRSINTQALVDLWKGKVKDDYGYAAVIGTAAIYLITLKPELSPAQAIELADSYWQKRDKNKL